MYRIGVDLGGTKVAAALIDENNRILNKISAPTEAEKGNDRVAENIAALVWEICRQADIKPSEAERMGIAAPGAIDSDTGYIERAHNLMMEHYPLVEKVRELTGVSDIRIENDANAAALGEAVAGAAKGTSCSVMVTLGTGVGGGFVIGGKVFSGFNHIGGEFGHMVIEYNGRQCNCGRRGCWESYSSATALVKRTREVMEENPDSELHNVVKELGKVNGRASFIAARRGDKAALALVDEYVSYLCCGIANMINMLQPEVLCLGGGISNEGDGLMIPLQKKIDEAIFVRGINRTTQVRIAELANDAGLIGAVNL